METFSSPRKVVIAVALLMCLLNVAGRGKKADKDSAAAPDLPKDLNLAALRVRAIDTIYELDLSPQQLHAMANSSANLASDRVRTPAVANDKLAAALDDFNEAMLEHKDDDEVAKCRNAVAELITGDDVHLDDTIDEPSDAARNKALGWTHHLSVSQVAAFIAHHADQIADPTDKMISLLTELRESGNPAGGDAEIQTTADQISREVAGRNDKKAKDIAVQIVGWFKDNKDMSEEDITSKHDDLEAAAKKIIGNDFPVDMLNKWLNNEMATLFSNPQLSDAISAVLATN